MNTIEAQEKNAESTEKRTFFITTVVLMPIISVSIVGALGFFLWFSQNLFA